MDLDDLFGAEIVVPNWVLVSLASRNRFALLKWLGTPYPFFPSPLHGTVIASDQWIHGLTTTPLFPSRMARAAGKAASRPFISTSAPSHASILESYLPFKLSGTGGCS